jgi:hypothetical protein
MLSGLKLPDRETPISALALGFQAKYRGLDRGKKVRNNMIFTGQCPRKP